MPFTNSTLIEAPLAHNLGSNTQPTVGRVDVQECGFGAVRQTLFTFTGVQVAMTDQTTAGSQGNYKFYDFPEGAIIVHSAVTNLTLARLGTALTATSAVVAAIGTVAAATDNATLLTTEANVIPSTACTLSSGAGTFAAISSRSITALTDSSGGTAADTIAAIGGTYSQAEVRNAVASLAAKINTLIDAVGVNAPRLIDGTATASDLYLNFATPDAGSTGNDSLVVNGTILVTWTIAGDK